MSLGALWGSFVHLCGPKVATRGSDVGTNAGAHFNTTLNNEAIALQGGLEPFGGGSWGIWEATLGSTMAVFQCFVLRVVFLSLLCVCLRFAFVFLCFAFCCFVLRVAYLCLLFVSVVRCCCLVVGVWFVVSRVCCFAFVLLLRFACLLFCVFAFCVSVE